MKPKDVQNAVPAVGAVGVAESVRADGSGYDEYDVTISVTFSPKAGQAQTVASKVVRMSAKKFAAFREDTNLWDGKKFLEEEFKDEWDGIVQRAHDEGPTYVVVGSDGKAVDGQGLRNTNDPAKSSVAINSVNTTQDKPDVTRAPAKVKDSAYYAPVNGPDAENEGNVETFPYEANDTNDFKVPENVQNVGGEDPQLPEQEKPANPKVGKPEQEGTDTAEQPLAAEVVEKAQGGATAATEASKTGEPQVPDAGGASVDTTDTADKSDKKAK